MDSILPNWIFLKKINFPRITCDHVLSENFLAYLRWESEKTLSSCEIIILGCSFILNKLQNFLFAFCTCDSQLCTRPSLLSQTPPSLSSSYHYCRKFNLIFISLCVGKKASKAKSSERICERRSLTQHE